MSQKLHLVSLGCPKNRVDSEVMLGVALGDGFVHVKDAEEADIIVVNTCGFIGEAKKESIETIFEMARMKDDGECKKLIVTGCLAQRHPQELADQIPEIDHLLGSSDMMKLKGLLTGEAARILVGTPADWLISEKSPRALSSRPGSAYLKIAEGCNRTCSFCVIPDLRGKQRSRSIDDIVREAERLIAMGVGELNIISQDTIAYGRDRDDGANLLTLVRALSELDGLRWIRIFYLYPETLSDELCDLLANHPKVLPYVDMPLQHVADGMLRRMRRGHGGKRLYEVVQKLRDRVPGLTFRTAFIVGHPGETDEEFEELKRFITWAEFDRVGFFLYSDEESSRSFELEAKVPAKVAQKRRRELERLQRSIMDKKNQALIGQELEVLVEGESDEHEFVVMGRHRGQAPDIDGQVYLDGEAPPPGTFARVRITQSADADLVGQVLDPIEAAPKPKKKPAQKRLPVI